MRALIAGASIAGPALAFWLERHGWDVTVVERASEFRTGGQNIDVRGAGREVLRRMGLEDAVLAATTGERGTRFLGEGGRVVAEFPAGRSDTGGATAEVEVLRGDLARILVDASGDRVTYRYGDRIVATDERDDPADGEPPVAVTFASGAREAFDIVVAADGARSSTRRLVFGSEVQVRPIGMETTYLTIPKQPGDTDWWNWYNATDGRSVTLRPDRHGTTRAVLSSTMRHADAVVGWRTRRTLDEQRARLHDQFRDVGYAARRILDALGDADDMYFETLAQIRAPHWSRGRVVLTGDAAWCASPVSGMGTSLSIVGAYVLAGQLAEHRDHRAALAGYERIMRPYVDQAQDLPPGVPQIANPRTRFGLAAFHTALRLASTPLVGRLGSRLFRPPADRIDLPDHGRVA